VPTDAAIVAVASVKDEPRIDDARNVQSGSWNNISPSLSWRGDIRDEKAQSLV
jgi:hypothetical protein